MKAIHIDATKKIVTEVEIEAGNLDEIYELLGCQIFTAVYIGDRDCIYVDDEGLLTNPQYFFKVPEVPHPLAGNGLIVGTGTDGETVAPFGTYDVTFLDIEEVVRGAHNSTQG